MLADVLAAIRALPEEAFVGASLTGAVARLGVPGQLNVAEGAVISAREVVGIESVIFGMGMAVTTFPVLRSTVPTPGTKMRLGGEETCGTSVFILRPVDEVEAKGVVRREEDEPDNVEGVEKALIDTLRG